MIDLYVRDPFLWRQIEGLELAKLERYVGRLSADGVFITLSRQVVFILIHWPFKSG